MQWNPDYLYFQLIRKNLTTPRVNCYFELAIFNNCDHTNYRDCTADWFASFPKGSIKFISPRFVLFGGNVHGKFEELVPNTRIAQLWRLKQWPAGHFSKVILDIEEKVRIFILKLHCRLMCIVLRQDDHTELRLTQSGVPTSEASTTQNNWERYYWNSIKQTFGFGSFLVWECVEHTKSDL